MSRVGILGEISVERDRQIAKWGVQSLPSIMPAMFRKAEDICQYYGVLGETAAKAACDGAARLGVCTHAHVLIEEVAEAISCGTDEVAMRKELIQVAAVAVKWIEDIDYRAMMADPRG